MDVIMTAAVTANGMIAHDTRETVSWSQDLRLFRDQTMGQTVIMGSTTASTLATELDRREVVVMHRDSDLTELLANVKTPKCFVIGGSRTYTRFAPFLTHVYLTYHPLIFPSRSVPLFSGLQRDILLQFDRMVQADAQNGIYQFQYRVLGN
ncbi:MAG: dihydrofolate reductase [Candidatus Neomarinimicrobiota bacterium]